MKRTLAITVMCMLLCATVGATAAVAKVNQPAGKSSVYHYTVNIDPTGTGKLVVNMKQQTFTFTGKGCQPGTYHLYYTSSTGRVDLGTPTDADAYGNLAISGKCTATNDELKTAVVSETAPPEPIKASFTATFLAWGTDIYTGEAGWDVDASSSTGPITKYSVTAKYQRPDGSWYDMVLSEGAWPNIGVQCPADPWNVNIELTLTVYDAAGHSDSMTKTVVAPYEPVVASFTATLDPGLGPDPVWIVDLSASAGPITSNKIDVSYYDMSGNFVTRPGSVYPGLTPIQFLVLPNGDPASPVMIKLTVYDAAGHSNYMIKTTSP